MKGDKCIFCDNEQDVKPGCRKQTWKVCKDHIKVKCPLCGHSAFWMECMMSGDYYACFRCTPWCDWKSDVPPGMMREEDG